MKAASILVVEHDRQTRMLIEGRLQAAGYQSESVASGEQALTRLHTTNVDLLIIDLWLPQISGMAVIEAAKAHDPDLEVIVMTASTTLESALQSLRRGVFGYIIKPGQPGELESTVAGALSRRRERLNRLYLLRQLGSELMRIADAPSVRYMADAAPGGAPAQPIQMLQVGSLRIDPRRYTVTRDSQPIQLSASEFNLLVYMASHSEQVLAPQQITRAVLGYDCAAYEARELIKVRVHKLRRKIEINPTAPQLLISVRGAGYMLTAGR